MHLFVKQAKDSSDHGIECEKMEKVKGHFYEDFVRLLSRIIFKIKVCVSLRILNYYFFRIEEFSTKTATVLFTVMNHSYELTPADCCPDATGSQRSKIV